MNYPTERNQTDCQSNDRTVEVTKAEIAADAARLQESALPLLKRLGIVPPDATDLLQATFDWDQMERVAAGFLAEGRLPEELIETGPLPVKRDPSPYPSEPAVAVGQPKGKQEPIAADDIVRILDVLASGEIDQAEGLASELLHSHRDAVTRCASRVIWRQLDRNRLDVRHKLAKAIERHFSPDEAEGTRAARMFPIVFTSLAFVAYHRRAQSRLGRRGQGDAVSEAVDDSLAWHTS